MFKKKTEPFLRFLNYNHPILKKCGQKLDFEEK